MKCRSPLKIGVILWSLAAAGYAADSVPSAEAATQTPQASNHGDLLLGAHRGGRSLWPENTAFAYTRVMERWPEVMLEGDTQTTADGQAVLIHDETVDRTTDGTGLVKERTLAEIQKLDAGYQFTPDGGKTFPFRGQGIRIPTLQEVLELTPNNRILIELKRGEGVVEAVVRAVRSAHAESRFYAASINPLLMRQLNELAPDIATSFDFTTAMAMIAAMRYGDWEHYTSPCAVLSIPPDLEKRFGLTPDEIKKIRGKGIIYQVFTINRREDMEFYLQRGVDSILSDKPDLLAEVIAAAQASSVEKKP